MSGQFNQTLEHTILFSLLPLVSFSTLPTHTHSYDNIHTNIHTCRHPYTHPGTHPPIPTNLHTHINTNAHTLKCTCTHTYAHVHILHSSSGLNHQSWLFLHSKQETTSSPSTVPFTKWFYKINFHTHYPKSSLK